MTKLSVNVNKIATLRNARGGNIPNVLKVTLDCESFGAEGITVHPRPDERHIRYADVYELRPAVSTEFNIEGYPSEKFLDMVLKVKPTQVTLVPDAHDVITSNAGWDTKNNFDFLSKVVDLCKSANIRTYFRRTGFRDSRIRRKNRSRPYRIIYRALRRSLSTRQRRCDKTIRRSSRACTRLGIGRKRRARFKP